jgi:hypothetical protein
LNQLNVPPDALHDLQSNVARLAAIAPPKGVDPATAAQITSLISRSFVFGFRLIMLLCAALSLMSSGFAWRLIAGRTNPGRL